MVYVPCLKTLIQGKTFESIMYMTTGAKLSLRRSNWSKSASNIVRRKKDRAIQEQEPLK